MEIRETDRIARKCMLVFCTVYVGVAVIFAAVALPQLLPVAQREWEARQLSLRMRSWTETPARLIQYEPVSRTERGAVVHGVTARYTYTRQGREYAGTRVCRLTEMQGNNAVYDRIAAALGDAMKSGTPVPCYVDPDDPASAVLDRTTDWMLPGSAIRIVVPGFFLLMLLFAVYAGSYALRTLRDLRGSAGDGA